MNGYDRIELKAAAARLMLSDKRDYRDYDRLIEFIDFSFDSAERMCNKVDELLEAIEESIDAAGKPKDPKEEPQNE